AGCRCDRCDRGLVEAGVVSGSRHSRFRLFLDDPLADLPDAPTENRVPPVHDAHCPLLLWGRAYRTSEARPGASRLLAAALPVPVAAAVPASRGRPGLVWARRRLRGLRGLGRV